MSNLKAKEGRSDKEFYTPEAEAMRETTMVRPQKQARLDFEVGDIVQINSHGKKYIGCCGVIIGKTFQMFQRSSKEIFVYTVMFSDKESYAYSPNQLKLVRKGSDD